MRPARVFLFRLAAQLGMTVAQLCQTMDSRELSEWMAIHRYYMPLQDSWHQTGVLASAVLAPYCGKSRQPKPIDFVPIEKAPQSNAQIAEAFKQLAEQLRANKDG